MKSYYIFRGSGWVDRFFLFFFIYFFCYRLNLVMIVLSNTDIHGCRFFFLKVTLLDFYVEFVHLFSSFSLVSIFFLFLISSLFTSFVLFSSYVVFQVKDFPVITGWESIWLLLFFFRPLSLFMLVSPIFSIMLTIYILMFLRDVR